MVAVKKDEQIFVPYQFPIWLCLSLKFNLSRVRAIPDVMKSPLTRTFQSRHDAQEHDKSLPARSGAFCS